MKYANIILILATMLLLACANENNNKTNIKKDNNESIQTILNQLLEENNVPGINFSVIHKNGQQNNYSVGFADTEKQQALTKEHVLFTGSVGKTFAVALLMQLVDEGKVDLEREFISYFPEVEWLALLPNIQDVTVAMLLQHTSGLPRYIENQDVWKSVRTNPNKVWTYKDRLSYVFNAEAVHEAGKGWAYSDTNYLLIGMLIEKITASYYYDELAKRILKPGNLNETYAADKRMLPNLATGYSKLDTFFRMPDITVDAEGYIFNPQMEWTGGGIASTTPDLAKWAKLYFSDKLFSKGLFEKIVTPYSDIGNNEFCGMGSFIFNTKIDKAYGHTGFIPGFVAIFAYYPKQEIAVALQINCDYAKKKMGLIEYLDRLMPEVIGE